MSERSIVLEAIAEGNATVEAAALATGLTELKVRRAVGNLLQDGKVTSTALPKTGKRGGRQNAYAVNPHFMPAPPVDFVPQAIRTQPNSVFDMARMT